MAYCPAEADFRTGFLRGNIILVALHGRRIEVKIGWRYYKRCGGDA